MRRPTRHKPIDNETCPKSVRKCFNIFLKEPIANLLKCMVLELVQCAFEDQSSKNVGIHGMIDDTDGLIEHGNRYYIIAMCFQADVTLPSMFAHPQARGNLIAGWSSD